MKLSKVINALSMIHERSNRKIGVLISGRGSNLQAIIDSIEAGTLNAKIAVVISNKLNAEGLVRAKDHGIETIFLDHRDYSSREKFDLAVVEELKSRDVSLVCLAGFMRLLSATFDIISFFLFELFSVVGHKIAPGETPLTLT